MSKQQYYIEPILVKRWFREPVVMYALCETGEYWDDPSYGNGGGDWRTYTKVVYKYPSFNEAKVVLDKLVNTHHNTPHDKQGVDG